MRPWYAVQPRQLDGLRVATVADPVAVSRAWALQLLTDAAAAGRPKTSTSGLTRVPAPEAQRGDLPVGVGGSLRSPRGGAGHRRRQSGPGRPRGPAAPGGPPPFRPAETARRPVLRADLEGTAASPGRGRRDPDPAARGRAGRPDPVRVYRPRHDRRVISIATCRRPGSRPAAVVEFATHVQAG